MKLTPILPMLRNGSLRVGDSIGMLRNGALVKGELGFVSAIRDQSIMVYWIETGSNLPVAERMLPQILYMHGRASFDDLLTWWANDTCWISSIKDIMNHPAVELLGEEPDGERLKERLIGALDLPNGPTWGILTFLHRMTGEQPFLDEDRGDVPAMCEAWRLWLHRRKRNLVVNRFRAALERNQPKWMRGNK